MLTRTLTRTGQLAAILVATVAPAYALEASKTVDIKAPPAKVWATIGDFCGIAQWHPAIASCTPTIQGRAHLRALTLKGGGAIVERQLARSDRTMSYSYTIVSGPLPVDHYRSTIAVKPSADGSTVSWSGSFVAKGADDAHAVAAIQGIYDTGLAALSGKAVGP